MKRENATSVLAETHPASKLVRKVGLRIATAAGVSQHELATWQFLVIRDDQPNAFVLPGGFVCVYTGLFRVAPTEVMIMTSLLHSDLCLSSSLTFFSRKLWHVFWLMKLDTSWPDTSQRSLVEHSY